jgi:hypothetical protein
MDNSWTKFEEGRTIGQQGSEGGIILVDEEIISSARITLEEEGDTAPYSITMGIYCLPMHTHFCSTLEEAAKDYEMFKTRIEEILSFEDNVVRQQKIEELTNI